MDFVKRAFVVAVPTFFVRSPQDDDDNKATVSSPLSPDDDKDMSSSSDVKVVVEETNDDGAIDFAKDSDSAETESSSVDGVATTTMTGVSLARVEEATKESLASTPPPLSFDSAATASNNNPTTSLQTRQQQQEETKVVSGTGEETSVLTREKGETALPDACRGVEATQPTREQDGDRTSTSVRSSFVENKRKVISVSAATPSSKDVPSSSSMPSTTLPLKTEAANVQTLPPLPVKQSMRQQADDYEQTLRNLAKNAQGAATASEKELPCHTSVQDLEMAVVSGTALVNADKAMQNTCTNNSLASHSSSAKSSATKAKSDECEILPGKECTSQPVLNVESPFQRHGETPQGSNDTAANEAKTSSILPHNEVSPNRKMSPPHEATSMPIKPQSKVSTHATTSVEKEVKNQVNQNDLSTGCHVAFQARILPERQGPTTVHQQETNHSSGSFARAPGGVQQTRHDGCTGSIETNSASSTENTNPILFYKCPFETCPKLFAFSKDPNPQSDESDGAPSRSSQSNTSLALARKRVLGHLRNEHPTVSKETLLSMLSSTYPVSAFTFFTCPVDDCGSEFFCGNSLEDMHAFVSKYGPDSFVWPISPFDPTLALVREHMSDHHPCFSKEDWKVGLTTFSDWKFFLARPEDPAIPKDSDGQVSSVSLSPRTWKREHSEVDSCGAASGTFQVQNPMKRQVVTEPNNHNGSQNQESSPNQDLERRPMQEGSMCQEDEYFDGVSSLFGSQVESREASCGSPVQNPMKWPVIGNYNGSHDAYPYQGWVRPMLLNARDSSSPNHGLARPIQLNANDSSPNQGSARPEQLNAKGSIHPEDDYFEGVSKLFGFSLP